MLSDQEARSIAAGWISPNDQNLTAFATGHVMWNEIDLMDEIELNITDVKRHPDRYDDPAQCLSELGSLLDWINAY